MDNKQTNKVQHLIVDTSAFIKNVGLQDIGENITTVQSVVDEINCKRQLKRLVVLPYDLKIKDTSPEHVQFVTEFGKKTGDYLCLSATDIQVIALTYQIEKEIVGVGHLRTEPLHKPVINLNGEPLYDVNKVAGFHLPSNIKEKESTEDKEPSSDSEDESIIDDEDIKGNTTDDNVELILRQVDEEENEEYDEEEDEDDWITPNNIDQVKKQLTNDDESNEEVQVACLTTDFAMQNVLKQIGLNVVTLEGKLIKELRTYILRCYGCFKTTSIMTKLFCPNCGNKTLKRVAVTVNPDGTQHIHINTSRPLTARGKKYSLPKFIGGKHANNPILCEDQPQPQQRVTKLSRMRNNPLDPDYIAAYSPFIMRDVTSKAAMLGLRTDNNDVKHWMKKNPNEACHRSRRKKK